MNIFHIGTNENESELEAQHQQFMIKRSALLKLYFRVLCVLYRIVVLY